MSGDAAGWSDGLSHRLAGEVGRLRAADPPGHPVGVTGVGIDAVEIDRFTRVLARRAGMAGRLFTPGELAYARSAAAPAPRLSTRFAAKEAAMKALGVGLGSFPFHDVEVVRDGLDAPRLVLHGAALALARRAGVTRWHLSLTHTARTAMALVVAEGTPSDPVTSGPRTGPVSEAGAGPVLSHPAAKP